MVLLTVQFKFCNDVGLEMTYPSDVIETAFIGTACASRAAFDTAVCADGLLRKGEGQSPRDLACLAPTLAGHEQLESMPLVRWGLGW